MDAPVTFLLAVFIFPSLNRYNERQNYGTAVYIYRHNCHTGMFRHHVLVLGNHKFETVKNQTTNKCTFRAQASVDLDPSQDGYWDITPSGTQANAGSRHLPKWSRRLIGWTTLSTSKEDKNCPLYLSSGS